MTETQTNLEQITRKATLQAQLKLIPLGITICEQDLNEIFSQEDK